MSTKYLGATGRIMKINRRSSPRLAACPTIRAESDHVWTKIADGTSWILAGGYVLVDNLKQWKYFLERSPENDSTVTANKQSELPTVRSLSTHQRFFEDNGEPRVYGNDKNAICFFKTELDLKREIITVSYHQLKKHYTN